MAEGRDQLKVAALLAALALAAGACAPVPTQGPRDGARAPDAGDEPARGETLSAAGSALLVQSRNERRAGDYAQASATLERALRIEPTSPAVWLELARLRLLEGNYTQAEQLARKAHSLAGPGSTLAEESRAVLADALRRQGRAGEAGALPPGRGA